MAYGLKALELEAKDVQSRFKLVGVEIKDGRSVARIVWTGSCRIGKEEDDFNLDKENVRWRDIGLFAWERAITFDLENKRVLQWVSRNTVQGEGSVPWEKT